MTNVSEPTLFRPNEMTRTGFVARNIRDEEAHANHTKISRTWIKIWFTVPFAWYICAMNLWKSNKSVGYKLTTLIDMKMVCVCVKFYTWNILNLQKWLGILLEGCRDKIWIKWSYTVEEIELRIKWISF